MTTNGFFAVLVCIFSYCGQPFDIVSATSQIYHAGRVESGGGINLELVLIAKKSSKKVKFENVAFSGEYHSLRVCNSASEIISNFQKGDTLLVKSTILLSPTEMSKGIDQTDEYLTLHYLFKNKENIAWAEPVAKEELYLP